MWTTHVILVAISVFVSPLADAQERAGPPRPGYLIEGNSIPSSLTDAPGSADRGRLIVAGRQKSLCVLCHAGLIADPHQQGNLGPSLRGIGARLSEGQLRLRIVDSSRVNPETIMPSYLRTEGLVSVAPAYRGRSLLSPQDIEDVIAYLATLKE